jgi:hypothetical protein
MKSKNIFSIIVIFLLFSVILYSDDNKSFLGDLKIEGNRVGNIFLESSVSDILRLYNENIVESYVMREGLYPALELTIKKTKYLTLEIDTELDYKMYYESTNMKKDNSKIWAIRVHNDIFTTLNGVKIGDAYSTVKRKYPKAELDYGNIEGKYLSLFDKKSNIVFEFDVSTKSEIFLENGNLDFDDIKDLKIEMILIK